MINRVLCILLGYVCGLFQTGYLYGKLHGVDIRSKGSGNVGTTNSLRVLGKKAGAIVLAGDAGKTVAAILLAHLIFGTKEPGMDMILQLYAGLGATLGHNFPFYLHFKGGKGIAVLAGIYLACGITCNWIPFCIGFVLFFAIFFVTHYVSVSSMTVSALFFGCVVVMERTRVIVTENMAGRIELTVLAAVIMIMAFVRHGENIKRLMAGNERKTYLGKKNKTD